MKTVPFSRNGKVGAGRLTRVLIAAFAVFVIILTWAAPLQRIRYEREEAAKEAIAQTANRAVALQQYASRTLEAADITTLHIAELYADPDSPLRKGSRARPATISGAIARTRSFLGISIADARGDLVASTIPDRAAGQNVRGREAFEVHARGDSNRLFVSKPAFSRVLGRDVIWLTRRLNGADGSFTGTVAINIAPEQLTAIYEDVTVDPTDVISLIGLDGITRARRTGTRVSTGENLNGHLVMRMQEKHPNGSYAGPGALDGLTRYFSHRRLEGYPLFATYGVLRSAVLQPVEKRARLFTLVASIATLITAAFACGSIAMLRRRDRLAAQVAEANARLEEAQRIGRTGDWSYDLRTGLIGWSPQLFEMYERDPADAPLKLSDFEAYLDPESRQVLADAIARAIETGEPQSYEVTARLPSGVESHRLALAIPTRGADGKVIRLHGIDQDVSERKKLDRLEMEVTHLSRLEAMNAMAATLAHELNQPLTAASNYLAGSRMALAAQHQDVALAAEGVQAAQQQVLFAGEIIRRVRSMVTNDRKQMAPVFVSRIVDDAISLALAGDLRSIDITKDIAGDAAVVKADRVQIQQVLLNLIRNARDAAASVEKPAIVIRSARADAGYILISVEDNGPGFEADGAAPFSPFSSGPGGGLGLGLSISRTIVESHGGRIWVDGDPSSGGRVSFTIPAAT